MVTIHHISVQGTTDREFLGHSVNKQDARRLKKVFLKHFKSTKVLRVRRTESQWVTKPDLNELMDYVENKLKFK